MSNALSAMHPAKLIQSVRAYLHNKAQEKEKQERIRQHRTELLQQQFDNIEIKDAKALFKQGSDLDQIATYLSYLEAKIIDLGLPKQKAHILAKKAFEVRQSQHLHEEEAIELVRIMHDLEVKHTQVHRQLGEKEAKAQELGRAEVEELKEVINEKFTKRWTSQQIIDFY